MTLTRRLLLVQQAIEAQQIELGSTMRTAGYARLDRLKRVEHKLRRWLDKQKHRRKG